MPFVTTSPLDEEPLVSKVKFWIRDGEFNGSIVKKLKEENDYDTSDSAIRRFRKRHAMGIPTKEKGSVKVDGDEATLTTPVVATKGYGINRNFEPVEGGQTPANDRLKIADGQIDVSRDDREVVNDLKNTGAVNTGSTPLGDQVGEDGIDTVVNRAVDATQAMKNPFNDNSIPGSFSFDGKSEFGTSSPKTEPKVEAEEKADSDDGIRDRLNDPDSMLKERGLKPEDWSIEGVTVNEWDGPTAEGTTVTYKQAKLQLRRKKPEYSLNPARADGWKPTPRTNTSLNVAGNVDTEYFKTVVLVGDQQAPFHDRNLHRLFLDWLAYNDPDEGVLIGDTVDFPDVSRHRDNPENVASANDCIQGGYEILRDYVSVSQDTKWTKLLGNHDERIRNYVIDQAKALYGLKRAARSAVEIEEKVLDVAYLLRLDELGIDLVDPKGGYAQAQHAIDNAIAVRHGWLTRKGAGATALASLEALGYNIVVGHTHRQGIAQKTTHAIDGSTKTLVGVESGCMCSINNEIVEGRRFPDYTTAPDWQQGFAVATVYEDGTTNIELATYKDGSLFYRDQRFS